jgi:hypothetical protein
MQGLPVLKQCGERQSFVRRFPARLSGGFLTKPPPLTPSISKCHLQRLEAVGEDAGGEPFRR